MNNRITKKNWKYNACFFPKPLSINWMGHNGHGSKKLYRRQKALTRFFRRIEKYG